jgi:hypothetical protein
MQPKKKPPVNSGEGGGTATFTALVHHPEAPFQWLGACLPDIFCNDKAELHQESSQIMHNDICLPIYHL